MTYKEELESARKIKDTYRRALILARLAGKFPDNLKTQVFEEAFNTARKIKDADSRIRMLEKLAFNFDGEQKNKMLEETFIAAQRIRDKNLSARAMLNLAVNFNGKHKTQILKKTFVVARKIEDLPSRVRMLIILAPYFRDKHETQIFEEALDAAREIKDAASRFSALKELALKFDGKRRKQIFEEALDAAHEIKGAASRFFALKELALKFDGKRRKQIFEDALDAAHKIKDAAPHFFALKELAPVFYGNRKRQILKELPSLAREIKLKADASWVRNNKPRKGTYGNGKKGAVYRNTKKYRKVKNNTQKKIKLNFTAYYPKEGGVEFWHILLVYTHILSALKKIQEDAKRFDDQIKLPKKTTSKSLTPIVRGTELTIVPSCEGIIFNPERVSFKWLEDFHRADFRFKADKSLSGDAAKGSIDIYVGPLIIGTLKFAMLFNDKESQPVPDHEEHAKMYGKDDVFISYSRKDSEIARTFKTVLEGTGLDVFLDVDDIRSGQLWEKELKRRIKRAKIFQIFWSANYSQSENCKQEWEYALKQNKDEGFIRPIFWQKPLSPNPPEELNKFNFKYVELKI